jgi:hypothetical protein
MSFRRKAWVASVRSRHLSDRSMFPTAGYVILAVDDQSRGRVGRNFSTAWKILSRRAEPQTSEQSDALVGLAEVAAMLEVTKRTATTYSTRDDFPPPLQRLAATPVWKREDVAIWAEETLPLTRGRPPTSRV